MLRLAPMKLQKATWKKLLIFLQVSLGQCAVQVLIGRCLAEEEPSEFRAVHDCIGTFGQYKIMWSRKKALHHSAATQTILEDVAFVFWPNGCSSINHDLEY